MWIEAQAYKTFSKYFKKNQQVCIQGGSWDSFGYISKITPEGIWLYQLTNSKEILYNWRCFEIVYTPGYKVYKSSTPELTSIFNIRMEANLVEDIRSAPKFDIKMVQDSF